jgi:probable phosphoglycerate mutase
MMQSLVARHPGQRVVAVTHGGVLDCIYRVGSGMPLHEPRRFDILNASINRIDWDGERFHLRDWADVAHLDDALDDVEPRAD